jgi:integrase/recombinase XerC
MHLDQFLNYLQFEKRCSSHTITAYTSDLQAFSLFLKEIYELENLQEINYQQIRSWIVSLLENNYDEKSINRKISCLKSYFNFLVKNYFIPKSPMGKVVSPKQIQKLPVFIEKQGMDNLLDGQEFEQNFEGNRDRLILEMFYCTGMRLNELINIKIPDVDFSRENVKVLGKRNKERIIPMLAHLIALIKSFLAEWHLNPIASNYLFTNAKSGKISPRLVYKIVNAYLSRATTSDKKSPHVLRHTFATHMLNNGADLNAIKEILGHANLQATQIYTHNSIERLKSIHKQAHPRA